ncbi:MAG: hypothetical protein IKE31_03845, partial [Eubacterium sp.]|nr:hypothetical protein [Eubacterium sp.]
MKKLLAIAVAGLMAVSLAACGGSADSAASSAASAAESAVSEAASEAEEAAEEAESAVSEAAESEAEEPAEEAEAEEGEATEAAGDLSGMKVGFIFLHDENSTYDLNFINGAKEAAANLGLSEDQIILKTNIPEGQECYDEAAELA